MFGLYPEGSDRTRSPLPSLAFAIPISGPRAHVVTYQANHHTNHHTLVMYDRSPLGCLSGDGVAPIRGVRTQRSAQVPGLTYHPDSVIVRMAHGSVAFTFPP